MKRIILLFGALILFNAAFSQTTLNEGFETWPPEDWQILELGAALDGWTQDFESIFHTGSHSAFSSINNSQCDNWLVSSPVNVSNGNYELKYWEFSNSVEYYDKASVLISTGSNDPTSGDFVEVFEANNLNTIWEERNIDLSAYNGQTIYVAFRYEGTWHKWYIDDVSISPVSFTDGALTEVISPVGVSETPTTDSVTIKLENLGTTVINDFSVNWSINGIAQTTYSATALNLLPGENTNLDIGTYSFTIGANIIEANLNLTGDFSSINNTIQSVYEISTFKDGTILSLTPEGMSPNEGAIDVIVEVANIGNNIIDATEILWSVDGISQTPYFTANLNLAPGETTDVTIGQYTFASGLHDITATLNIIGDIDETNDQYNSIAAINTFWESFEGAVFPPEGWSFNFGILDNLNFDTPPHGEKYYSTFADSNYFGVVSDTLYTPLLNIAPGDKFNFYIKTNDFSPIDHSLVMKNGVTGVVQTIQTIANNTSVDWEYREIDISSAAGINYIGIVSSPLGNGHSKLDLITSDASLYLYDRDLKIMNGDMHFLARQNTEESFKCVVKNNGALEAIGIHYTVKLMESPGVELASVNGVDIDPWEETTFTINHTFNNVGRKRLYFEVYFLPDQNNSNNTFRESSVSVVPNTVEFNVIGSATAYALNYPFTPNGSTNTLGEDDISQTLYFNDEFNSTGYVYGMAYKYDNILMADKVTHYPLKVWIAQTDIENLDGGFLPNNQLTLVFDGIVEILPGYDRTLYIPFSQPILLNGIDNVVIQDYQYDPEWPPSIFRFYGNNLESGPTRTISLIDVYELDPNDLPEGFFSTSSYAFTGFVIDPSTSKSILSGTVYNSVTNNPIENAIISVDGSTVTIQTDMNGDYTLPELPYGMYNISASFTGFMDSLIEVDLNSPTQTQDYYLDPLSEISITGNVFGSNATSTPLEFVDVRIIKDGATVETTMTDSNGEFTFPIIFGGSDYDIAIFLYGYYEKTITISAADTNINLGDIFLDQEFISPFDVSVNSDAQTLISWKSPLESKKIKMQEDLGVVSYSFTNEPNENVWLGNFFYINDVTTLTSVEIQTDIYENAIDYVTIDVFDLNSENILASSEPFLIYADSLHTVNIPNIVVYDDIAVMLHWENNAASTNPLGVDYSDPNIRNRAVIKYPDNPIYLLTDAFGEGTPNMSFLVRVNTLDDANPVTNEETPTYNVYRGLASEFPDIINWNLVNTVPITDISLVDANIPNLDPNEIYRYAVETIYTDGNSEVTFSNNINGQLLGNENFEAINSGILIYPVPSKDVINIKFEPFIQLNTPIEMFDILGKKIEDIDSSGIQNGLLTKNINKLENGIYFLKFNVDGVIVNKKFIVNH